jgi:GNAT superfamily N-acetyltransferase
MPESGAHIRTIRRRGFGRSALHFCSVTQPHGVLTVVCMMTSSSGLCLGASFEQAVRLEDGRRVRLRWIRRTDADLVRDGFARLVRSVSNKRSAELAVTVTDDTQGRGLGRLLVATLAAAAHERGVDTFEMSVLGRNWRVREFLRRRHAEFRCRDGEVLEYALGTAAIVAGSRRPPKSARPGLTFTQPE